jgi:UDP-N-acetylglucosamine 1-carboxyvinyltransferase
MESIKITGGRPLKGVVDISGAKNAATKELVACLLTKVPVTLTNVPQIGDVDVTIDMLKGLGVSIERDGDRVTIDASTLSSPK